MTLDPPHDRGEDTQPDPPKKRTRGRTVMRALRRARARGEPPLVEFGPHWEPLGDAATMFSSYITTAVRWAVPIYLHDWRRDVPDELKNRIWDDIRVCKSKSLDL